ncbi:MAG: membrane protein insertase YidC [Proteobacteria bacterium]|nr:membrane protein insertase YidC [Pseudomonadota bacterium]MDA1351775.1 membrane protein insertase YidC [Pseudomonadota bacterium]
MDWQKTVLIAGMAIVAWMLVIQWNQFQDEQRALALTSAPPVTSYRPDAGITASFDSDELDSELPLLLVPAVTPKANNELQRNLITVKNNVIELVIDTLGGDIVSAKLLKHLDKMPKDGGQPLAILQQNNLATYVARSGLIGPNATDKNKDRPQFSSSSRLYEIQDNQEEMNIDLTFNMDGVRIVKRFQLSQDGYDVSVQYLISNLTNSEFNASFYGQIKRDSQPPAGSSGGLGVQPFLGAALREPEKNYAKYKFSEIEEQSVKTSITGGWITIVQHYFISAWVPPANDQNRYELRKVKDEDTYLVSVIGAPIVVAAGQSGSYEAIFYVGPKDQAELSNLAEYLDLTVDYGFLWMVGKPIFIAMQAIHGVVGNWGWSIILLTLLIKLILFPLSAASLKSMAKMRNLQPQMVRLKELYGDDRQKMSQETMSLYKKEKVNPAGGCFPMLLQMPVFLSLYWVLLESVEIRHAPWVLWIQDLSAKDPYFILPLIMGASMFFMQKMQPMPTDPMQAKVMQFMPIGFTFLFMTFPSGLVLYWTVNNLLSMAQQWYVNSQLIKKN